MVSLHHLLHHLLHVCDIIRGFIRLNVKRLRTSQSDLDVLWVETFSSSGPLFLPQTISSPSDMLDKRPGITCLFLTPPHSHPPSSRFSPTLHVLHHSHKPIGSFFCKSISQCYLHVNSSSQIFTIFPGEETWSRGPVIQPEPPAPVLRKCNSAETQPPQEWAQNVFATLTYLTFELRFCSNGPRFTDQDRNSATFSARLAPSSSVYEPVASSSNPAPAAADRPPQVNHRRAARAQTVTPPRPPCRAVCLAPLL